VRQRSVLLLCDDNLSHADTVLDHLQALSVASGHQVRRLNPRGVPLPRFLRLAEFDAVVIHYSLVCTVDHYLSPDWRNAVAGYRGLKLQFIQDEYRWIDAVTAMVRYLGVKVLFSALPPNEMRRIYESRLPGVRLEPTLTGYVPDRLVGLTVPDVAERPHHIVYRGRELPIWLGELANEKVRIAKGVAARAAAANLSTDIGWKEQDRIYGLDWRRFMVSGRATLGTGSGASIADFDGRVEDAVREYQRGHPRAGYPQIARAVLRPYEGNVQFDVVSPRIFEAIALRTALVLFPGWYSGVVEPGLHYIVLQRDFSNFADVAEKVRDDGFLRELTTRAYFDVVEAMTYSYRRLTEHFDRVVDEMALAPTAAPQLTYRASRLEIRLRNVGSGAWLASAAGRARQRRSLARLVGLMSRWPTVSRLLVDPGMYMKKGGWALGRTLSRSACRQALAAWLADVEIRRSVSFADLLEDILELTLAADAALVAEAPLRLAARYNARTRTLDLLATTCPDRAAAIAATKAALAQGVDAVIWDHTAAGGSFHIDGRDARNDIHIGESGRRTIVSLAVFARRRPEVAASLLLPLFGQQGGSVY
jgi:hypothetical protein